MRAHILVATAAVACSVASLAGGQPVAAEHPPTAMSPKEVAAMRIQQAHATWVKSARARKAARAKGRPAA